MTGRTKDTALSATDLRSCLSRTDKMTEKTNKTLRKLKKVIFPDKCPVCGSIKPQWFSDRMSDDRGNILCSQCKDAIKPITEPLCKKCGRSLEDEAEEYCGDCLKFEHVFAEGRSLYEYDGEMKALMYRFKYSNRRDLAEFFVGNMGEESRKWLLSKSIDAVVPIPLHPDKLKKRGYNQSYVFAKELADVFGLKMESGFLVRDRYTDPQKGLSRQERINNLKNAFILGQSGVKSNKMNILLVDDIYTTGATVDAAASVLEDAANVYFLCICNGRR